MLPLLLLCLSTLLAPPPAPTVTLSRLPSAILQPSVVVAPDGALHLIGLTGNPEAADILYLRRAPGKPDFDRPLHANSIPKSAVATGTIRGPQLALAPDNTVHIAWNASAIQPDGTKDHDKTPVYYARLDPGAAAFTPQRNLMTATTGLDGGCALAADGSGHVAIAWHGVPNDGAKHTEAQRRLFVTRSSDSGKTFAPESPAADDPTGACPCCGAAALADPCGRLLILYRAAHNTTERGMMLLRSDCADKDQPLRFKLTSLHPWNIGACPMSSSALAIDPRTNSILAWETQGQVYVARCASDTGALSTPVEMPGKSSTRKHPRLAIDARGNTLVAWTEGAGWQRGGSLAWQLVDESLKPIEGATGRADGVPALSFAAPVAMPDGRFVIYY